MKHEPHMYFTFLQKFLVFKAEKVDLINVQNKNNSHSISRYMLFWCPPILLAASQSYLPESDNFTSLMCRDERPCCPLTSTRPSGLCLHWFKKKKDFMFVLCKMMTKRMAFVIYIGDKKNLLTCIQIFFSKKQCFYIYDLQFLVYPFYLSTSNRDM